MTTRFTPNDFRAGALYRIAARRSLSRSAIVALLVERCGMKQPAAEQLAGHWLTTWPFRQVRP